MKVLLIIVLFFCGLIFVAQVPKIEITNLYPGFEHTSFVLIQKDIDIEGVFMKGGCNKPLIIFIEGSGFRPQFTFRSDSSFYKFTPDESLIDTSKYNYIFLSKPGIPLAVNIDSLDKNYEYINGVTQRNNLKFNNLSFNVETYETLLNEIDNVFTFSCIFLIGHSQGARIVAELSTCKKVSKIVYMSADPLGRIATQYDMEYSKFELRNVSKLEFYDSLLSPIKSDSIFWGDTYNSWSSFSKPSLISLSKSEKPTLIVYGDQDKNCPNCYVFSNLPLYCENINTIRYQGYNHNYCESNGDCHWDIVLKSVFLWLEKP